MNWGAAIYPPIILRMKKVMSNVTDTTDSMLEKLAEACANTNGRNHISILDLEDSWAEKNIPQGRIYTNRTDPDIVKLYNNNGADSSKYVRAGTLLKDADISKYLEFIHNESMKLSGLGSSDHILQNFLSRLDRHNSGMTPLNSMNYGFTFITRPRLNLSFDNLIQHPILSTLIANQPDSVPFMIRGLLDTCMSNGEIIMGPEHGSKSVQYTNEERIAFHEAALTNPALLDTHNPFLTPLCNGLKGISGFPDLNLRPETTEGDFHSGDFTFVKGCDFNNRTQELSLEFRDVQGSVILSILYYWCLYMGLQAKGVVTAYPDDIYEQRLNYTVSIYRFVTDQTRTNILWWCKATGCFPNSAPVGALFNISQGETTISSAMNFSIPFTANDVKVNDPGALLDFNMLMERYAPGLAPDWSTSNRAPKTGLTSRSNSPTNGGVDLSDLQQMNARGWYSLEGINDSMSPTNFVALPYIVDTNTGLKLTWRTRQSYLDGEGLTTEKAEDGKAKVNYVGEWNQKYDEIAASKQAYIDEMLKSMGTSTQTINNATSSAQNTAKLQQSQQQKPSKKEPLLMLP